MMAAMLVVMAVPTPAVAALVVMAAVTTPIIVVTTIVVSVVIAISQHGAACTTHASTQNCTGATTQRLAYGRTRRAAQTATNS